MPKEFRMPEIAESIVEGEIGKWFVREGSEVKKDAPLLEILTDKVNVEVPSPFEGVVEKILVPEGKVVKVGTPILLYREYGEEKVEVEAPRIGEEKKEEVELVAERKGERKEETVKAPPAVRALARELNVDLSRVVGTGPGGRITREDVEKAARQKEGMPPGGEMRIPYRGKRRMIGEHLRTSLDKAEHTLYVEEADVSVLVSLRERLKSYAESQGIHLTYLPFIAKAVVEALKKFPLLNASLDEEKEEIVVKKYYHIGFAVDSEDGLVVPVVRDVDKKGIWEIARELQQLAQKARDGTLSLDEVGGSTFSITSAGHIGGFLSMPLINYPECAILGVHRIRKRPVVENNQIVIRDVVLFSITFDHRIVDGALVARFMQEFISLLQKPEIFLLTPESKFSG
ncbi:MAG: dihydrolipoamide acetyltransferase family protein [bacterium JZ-2024 1]